MSGRALRAVKGGGRRPAARPEPRTVAVELGEESGFPGWWALARADFPARLIAELNSGDVDRIMAALGVIIVDHNMPGEDGELAPTLADVDPYSGLLAVSIAIGDALGRLPNR